jgi:hypothetical protein
MSFCESCGSGLRGQAHCENCGKPASVAPTVREAETSVQLRASQPLPTARGRHRGAAIAAGAALVVVTGAVITALLASGVLGDDGEGGASRRTVASQRAATTPTGTVARLESVPAHDLVDGTVDPYRLRGAVLLAADKATDDGVGVTEWGVYAVAGAPAETVCAVIEDRSAASDSPLNGFTNDPTRARELASRYATSGAGCVLSFVEDTPADPDRGPYEWDIAVREFAKGDSRTHDPQAVRTLGSFTPSQAPVFDGPYSEVSVVHRANAPDVPYDDGALAADPKPEQMDKTLPRRRPKATSTIDARSFVACDSNIRVSGLGCAFANNTFWTYWRHGQVRSITVYDPDTGRYHAASCSPGREVECSTAHGDAVRFPQSALDVYDDDQAESYAAGHDVG